MYRMMRRLLFLFVALIASVSFCKASEPEDIQAVVYKWNELHNTRDVAEFKRLYAADVLFYGRYRSRQTCYNQKRKFLTPDFHQEIISPVVLTYYSSGTIKCSFTKEVTFKNIVKKHKCYLLVKKGENGGYYVTGESDLVTDKKLNVQLNLGEELSSTGSNKGKYIAFGVLVAMVAGGFAYYKRKRRQQPLSDYVVPIEPIVEAPVAAVVHESQPVLSEKEMMEKVKAAVIEDLKGSFPEEHPSKKKGDDFEKYVVDRFNEKYYKLIDWRSDKIHNGKFAASNMHPDMVFYYKSKQQKARLAVECKWRAAFLNGKIEWAKDYQLRNYKQYQKEQGIPVFVIIGIGGQASEPETLYIVPLKDIYNTILTPKQLAKYKREQEGDFYYKAREQKLL